MRGNKLFRLVLALVIVAVLPVTAMGAFLIGPDYAGSYSAISLGSVPGVSPLYGGIAFENPSTLLIGGFANNSSGEIYAIGVTRGVGGHITGFSGTATILSDGAYNDGGLQYGPGGVLFYTQFPYNNIGEIKPGSSTTNKVVNLTGLVTSSVGALAFVPAGFPGAGQFKIVSYSGGGWYTATLTPDGSGTYNIASATLNVTPGGGPEGIAYVPLGSALFPSPSILLAEYGSGEVVSFQVDSNGNPILATDKIFMSGLSGAEGAVIDPVTGDFLFSTFGGGNQVIEVTGFASPVVPLPPSMLLLGSGLLGIIGIGRKIKRN